MSSTKVQRPVKIDNPEERMVQKERQQKELHRRATFNAASNVPKKHKHDVDGRKFNRKRSHNFIQGCTGKFFAPYKRRKKDEQVTLPTKFLLGGNIYDPLNLNSLQDEEVNRAMNAFTPKSSPLPTPKHRKGAIEVIIPPNLHDPLNLASCDNDEEYEQQLISPVKKTGRKPRSNRNKKKRNSSSGCSSKENSVVEGPLRDSTEVSTIADETVSGELVEITADVAKTETAAGGTTKMEVVANRSMELPLRKEQQKDKNKFRKFDLKDKIVSPVIPQSRGWTRPHGHRPPAKQQKKAEEHKPNFKPKDARYQYGNYNRYYGYRNPNHETDIRLKIFASCKGLFSDKDVLDIGCNVGHIALSVARDFNARSVVGLDIDRSLIAIARKNIRHYVTCKDSPVEGSSGADQPGPSKSRFYPISMPIVYGPVDLPGIGESPSARKKFPENVTFVQGNYVLDSDALLDTEQPQFDVILCLSITKWIHLNWGDAGLKQAFRRMYVQLRPGGKLVLEPQSWDSYKKRRRLTDRTFTNYQNVKFFPAKFTEYLLSAEVGFSNFEVMATPVHSAKGFQRPIQVFTKAAFSSTYSAGDSNTPYYTSVAGRSRAPVYTSVVVSTREPDEDDNFMDRNMRDCFCDHDMDEEVNLVFVKSESESTEVVRCGLGSVETGFVRRIVSAESETVEEVKTYRSIDRPVTQFVVEESMSKVVCESVETRGVEVENATDLRADVETETIEILSDDLNDIKN